MTAYHPILATLVAALAPGACAARDPARTGATGARFADLDATLDGVPARSTRAPTPVAALPAWIGRPVGLREHDGAGAFEQAITLDHAPRGAGRENLLLVKLPRGAAGAAGAGGRPSEAGIRAELDALFPGMPMQVVTRPAQNAYGPYGLAVGRAPGGARCLYAWQWTEAAPALDPGHPGPVSLRLRLCREDLTLEAMAAAMNEIALVPRFEGVASGRRHPAPRARAARTDFGSGVAPAPAPAAVGADLPPEATRGPAARTVASAR